MRLDIVRIAFGTAPLREGHIISGFTELIVPLSYVRLSHLAISHSTNPVPSKIMETVGRVEDDPSFSTTEAVVWLSLLTVCDHKPLIACLSCVDYSLAVRAEL
jgi:hypothetical protein